MKFTGPILVVDDEPHIRKYVSVILKQLGVTQIFEAGNGEDAVAAYQRDKPRLVLMDVNMPRIDGLQALRQLKEIDPECYVVMLTSLTNRETVQQALDLGAENYILKDTPKEEIAKALTETFDACFGEQTAPPTP